MDDETALAHRRSSDRWTAWSVAVVVGLFVAGLMVVNAFAPDPADGPTPGSTRLAYYAVGAVFTVALACIPLLVWVVERRGGARAATGWRLVLAAGVALAMAVLGLGVRTWAHPPHNLTFCAPEYRGNSTTDVVRIVCEGGRLNRPLGDRRLDEGGAGAVVVLALTGVVSARMRSPRSPSRSSAPTISA
ncbi:MAG TPA: hypothetical protein VE777_20500 [Gaiellales bacterium]|jgi:hypothetical protein|nr:hypothetical protein [Gaiellales bacterium]